MELKLNFELVYIALLFVMVLLLFINALQADARYKSLEGYVLKIMDTDIIQSDALINLTRAAEANTDLDADQNRVIKELLGGRKPTKAAVPLTTDKATPCVAKEGSYTIEEGWGDPNPHTYSKDIDAMNTHERT